MGRSRPGVLGFFQGDESLAGPAHQSYFRGVKPHPFIRCAFVFITAIALWTGASRAAETPPQTGRFLYVATPGIRDYLEFGGHGVLVFDIDHGHRFVRRIKSSGVDENGKPLNVKGICASAVTQRLYVSNLKTLICFDLQ